MAGERENGRPESFFLPPTETSALNHFSHLSRSSPLTLFFLFASSLTSSRPMIFHPEMWRRVAATRLFAFPS